MKTISVLRPNSRTTLILELVSALFLVTSLATIIHAAEDTAYVPGEILVGMKEGIDQDAIQAINAPVGAEIVYKYSIINAYQLSLPQGLNVPAAINFYNRQPEVEYAEPNYIVYADVIPNDPKFNNLWGLHNTGQTGGTSDADINAPEAWDITTGSQEIVVASIDSGVDYNHEDLKDNMWMNPGEIPGNGKDDDDNGFVDDVYGWDFYNSDNDPMDADGHGTHTSGTIGAVGNNSIGITGVCWNVKIMALRFMGPSGGSTADAIKCVEYATMMGARLSNNSWSLDSGGSSLLLGIAIWKGPLFITSAGNDDKDTDVNPCYPSSYRLRNIISVAATDDNDMLASFSNYGKQSVDLGAPGVNIWSTFPNDSGTLYTDLSGTSMSVPHVVGAAALVMAANPSLSDIEVKRCILKSVDKLPDLTGKVLTGGRLNAEKAVKGALTAAPPIAIAHRKLTHVNPPIVASSLGNAFPSPANPEVWIPYQLDAESDVSITIYNISGKVVRTLQIGHRPAGIYENKQLAAHWDGRNAKGEVVASGFYFYTLKAGDFTATRKLFIVR